MEKLLTKKEIARRYAVTTSCIDKWMAKRRIPYIRITGRTVRFDPDACDETLFGRLR